MRASSRYEFVSRVPLRHMFPDEISCALADAAGRGRIAQIEQKVAQGADVNARGGAWCNAFILAHQAK